MRLRTAAGAAAAAALLQGWGCWSRAALLGGSAACTLGYQLGAAAAEAADCEAVPVLRPGTGCGAGSRSASGWQLQLPAAWRLLVGLVDSRPVRRRPTRGGARPRLGSCSLSCRSSAALSEPGGGALHMLACQHSSARADAVGRAGHGSAPHRDTTASAPGKAPGTFLRPGRI